MATWSPNQPASSAAATLPAWLNASLRPIRRGSRPWPTSPRLIAETAGAKIADDAPMTACAAMITGSVGHHAIATTPSATASAASATAARLAWIRSISPPAGVCAATVANPWTDIAIPIRPASQCCAAARKMARNGPRPSRTSAMKTFRASSATRLRPLE